MATARWQAPLHNSMSNNSGALLQLGTYLQAFGYISNIQDVQDKVTLSAALSELQKSGGLGQTGVYDQATASLLSKPRCGIPDRDKIVRSDKGTEIAEFTHMGSKWDHTDITYRFDSWCAELTQDQVRRAISGALWRWSNISSLTFREVAVGTAADIRIGFVTGDHGDGYPFDNGGATGDDGIFRNVLAHAFSPGNGDGNVAGDCHFDEHEVWAEDYLFKVALHEFGHSIGLGHSDVPGSVMNAWFSNLGELQVDDIAGVQSRYGPRTKGWFNFQLERDRTISDRSGIAAVSRRVRSMEVWWIRADGAVIDAYWNDEGRGWTMFELAGAGSAAPGGGIAAVSRGSDYMEIFWVGARGSIEGAWWSQGMTAWGRQQLSAEGTAAINTRITAVSRIKDAMEVWWVAPNGSVQATWWTKNSGWNRYELEPSGSAATGSGIKAISRHEDTMELWYVTPSGAINDVFWYEGAGWNRFELAAADSAGVGSDIAAVSRIKDAMELWWISSKGAVESAYWYPSTGWKRYQLAGPGSAEVGGIEAVARIGESMEVWWSGLNGSIKDAYWYPQLGWNNFELAGPNSAKPGTDIAAVSRIDNSMELWFASPTGAVKDHYWYG